MQYTNPNSGNNISYSSLLIRNLNWPGSATIYKGGDFYSIYIGNGVRLGGNVYYPLIPNDIEKDPEDNIEYKEPNPDKEPEIIESDSDREDDVKDDNQDN